MSVRVTTSGYVAATLTNVRGRGAGRRVRIVYWRSYNRQSDGVYCWTKSSTTSIDYSLSAAIRTLNGGHVPLLSRVSEGDQCDRRERPAPPDPLPVPELVPDDPFLPDQPPTEEYQSWLDGLPATDLPIPDPNDTL